MEQKIVKLELKKYSQNNKSEKDDNDKFKENICNGVLMDYDYWKHNTEQSNDLNDPKNLDSKKLS